MIFISTYECNLFVLQTRYSFRYVLVRATSHLSVRLTAMPVTVNEVPSHLCKVLTLIIMKTYLQTGQRHYRMAGRPVVTCYNSAKSPQTSNSVRGGRTGRNGLYN